MAILAVMFYLAVNGRLNYGEVNAQPGCPTGQFQAGSANGVPICRIEPTGCPYGDSIPLKDCKKFEQPKPKVQPVQPYYGGGK